MKPKDPVETHARDLVETRATLRRRASPLLLARVRLHRVWPLMAKNFISFLSTGITGIIIKE